MQQAGDFDCALAVVAMIANTALEAVRGVAIARFHHPAHGPYRITGELIALLLAHYGYDVGMYEEPESAGDIPDLAIALVDYDDHFNLGRHVLFHRARNDAHEATPYVIDPAFWVPPPDHVRTCLPRIQWFLEVRPMRRA